jgi:hypothetical protein
MDIILRLKYALGLFIVVYTILTIIDAFFHFMDDVDFPFSILDIFLYGVMYLVSPFFWKKMKFKNSKK